MQPPMEMNGGMGNAFAAQMLASGQGEGEGEAFGEAFGEGEGYGVGDGAPTTGGGDAGAPVAGVPTDASADPADAVAGGAAALSAGATAIQHSTDVGDPDAQAFDRTDVGVGEGVRFWTNEVTPTGTWSSTGGTGVMDDGAYKWTAPATLGKVTITYTKDGVASSIDMMVYTPLYITSSGHSGPANPIPAQNVGAGMQIPLTFGPTFVSFGNVEWLEDPGPASTTHYWAAQDQSLLYHTPTTEWLSMGNDNKGVTDRADYNWYGPPYGTETSFWIWSIPNRWRIAGSGAGTPFWWSTQVMTLTPSGAATVTKFNETASRSTGA